jgi:hypothetical protein
VTQPATPEASPKALHSLGVGFIVLGFVYVGVVWVLRGRGIVDIPAEGVARWTTYFILGLPALAFFQTGQSLRRRAAGAPIKLPGLLTPFLVAAVAIWFTSRG